MNPAPLVGVYAIVHCVSGAAYIGSSTNVLARWESHERRLARGLHHSPKLQKLWDLDESPDFVFVVLESCSRSDLVTREQEWMNSFESLLNARLTARAGSLNDPSVSAKISLTLRGRPKSEEWKAKSSAAKMGHGVTVATREKLRTITRTRWADPNIREKYCASQRAGWTPEARANRSAMTVAWQAARDPEKKRLALAAASRVRWNKVKSTRAVVLSEEKR